MDAAADYMAGSIIINRSKLSNKQHIPTFSQNIGCAKCSLISQYLGIIATILFTIICIIFIPLASGYGGYLMIIKGRKYKTDQGMLIIGHIVFFWPGMFLLGFLLFQNSDWVLQSLKCRAKHCFVIVMFVGIHLGIYIGIGVYVIIIGNIFYGFVPMVFVFALIISCGGLFWLLFGWWDIQQKMRELKRNYFKYNNLKDTYYKVQWKKIEFDDKFDYILSNWMRKYCRNQHVCYDIEHLIYYYS